MNTTVDADDAFWDAALEACWRHHMGEPVGELAIPVDEPTRSVGEPGMLRAAGGWCAPFDPDRPPLGDVEPSVPRLACGCPEAVLETGAHEAGCTVLNIPAVIGDLS